MIGCYLGLILDWDPDLPTERDASHIIVNRNRK